jgi:hypothetical protein
MSNIIPTKAPNLLIAPPAEYESRYQEQLNTALRLYFNTIDNFSQNITVPSSGTTANRPADVLQVGQFYFDTTLGIPIWYNGTVWKNASGTTV